jgi:hypothetical protein
MHIEGQPDTGRSEDLAGLPPGAGGLFYEAVKECEIELTRLSYPVPKGDTAPLRLPLPPVDQMDCVRMS